MNTVKPELADNQFDTVISALRKAFEGIPAPKHMREKHLLELGGILENGRPSDSHLTDWYLDIGMVDDATFQYALPRIMIDLVLKYPMTEYGFDKVLWMLDVGADIGSDYPYKAQFFESFTSQMVQAVICWLIYVQQVLSDDNDLETVKAALAYWKGRTSQSPTI